MPQYLSTDPNAGNYLSTDPNAGGSDIPDPRQFEDPPDLRTHLTDKGMNSPRSLPQAGLELGLTAAAGGVGRLVSKIPAGRILTAAKAGGKAVIDKRPIIGPFKQGASEAWNAAKPAPAPPPAPIAPPTPTPVAPVAKPKLSAQQVAEMMRKEYGSAKAGQMLYGPARQGLKAVDRQAAIKRLTPQMESTLPAATRRAMERELAASSADEAFSYAAKAPNVPAKEHLGELLLRALRERTR